MPSQPQNEPLTAPPASPYVPAAVERLIVRAAREVKLIATLTPDRADRERSRLEAELRAGRKASPRWTYVPASHDELRRALDFAERSLSGSAAPLHALCLARVRELSLEAALCAAAGTSDVARLARQRFAERDPRAAQAASDLCAIWLAEAVPPPAAGTPIASDDPDSRSLLSQMRAAVGRLRLPFTVVPLRSLAPLAATGEQAIFVATGRLVHEADVIRTVLHEVEGHAWPRARCRDSKLVLLRVGTARGVDDQEGRALLLEERAGMLGPRRRRQLAARHRAVEAMVDGGSFGDVAEMLMKTHGLDAVDAVVIAERTFRGGDGTHAGLGRERVYLESFVRVRAHLTARPDDEAIMASGQVAIDAIGELREWIGMPIERETRKR